MAPTAQEAETILATWSTVFTRFSNELLNQGGDAASALLAQREATLAELSRAEADWANALSTSQLLALDARATELQGVVSALRIQPLPPTNDAARPVSHVQRQISFAAEQIVTNQRALADARALRQQILTTSGQGTGLAFNLLLARAVATSGADITLQVVPSDTMARASDVDGLIAVIEERERAARALMVTLAANAIDPGLIARRPNLSVDEVSREAARAAGEAEAAVVRTESEVDSAKSRVDALRLARDTIDRKLAEAQSAATTEFTARVASTGEASQTATSQSAIAATLLGAILGVVVSAFVAVAVTLFGARSPVSAAAPRVSN
jgi:hypothetical protein